MTDKLSGRKPLPFQFYTMSGKGEPKPQVPLRTRSSHRMSNDSSDDLFEQEPIPITVSIAAQSRRINPFIILVFYICLLHVIVSSMPSMPSIWYSNSPAALIPVINGSESAIEHQFMPEITELVNESSTTPNVTQEPVTTRNEPLGNPEGVINGTATLNSTSNSSEQVSTDTLPQNSTSN